MTFLISLFFSCKRREGGDVYLLPGVHYVEAHLKSGQVLKCIGDMGKSRVLYDCEDGFNYPFESVEKFRKIGK